jgi:uncharacterized protein YegL
MYRHGRAGSSSRSPCEVGRRARHVVTRPARLGRRIVRVGRRTALAIIAAATLVVPLVTISDASAEEAALRIVSAAHDPTGSLIVIADAPGFAGRELAVDVIVDGAPAGRAQLERVSDPLSVVIAIDTSLSMQGPPLVAAREAALALIAELSAADRVAVLAFDAEPRLVSDFTTNRVASRAGLQSLQASGDTALHDAVTFAATLLSRELEGARRIVLLSDGQDSNASAASADASLATVRAVGLPVYSFALGSESDRAYLSGLSESSGGRAWEVADSGSLAALFQQLGSELVRHFTTTVDLAPLPLGQHELAIVVDHPDGSLVASARFDVSNSGLLQLELPAEGSSGDPIEVRAVLTGLSDGLRLDAVVNGRPTPVVSGRVLVDPWGQNPGPVTLEVRALSGGRVIATAQTQLEIPELAPQLQQVASDGRLEVIGRVQGDGGATIALLADGEEIALTVGRVLSVATSELPAAESLSARLQAGDREQTLALALPETTGGGSSWTLLGAAAALLIGGAAWWLYHRASGKVRGQRAVASMVRGRRGAAPAGPPQAAPERLHGTLVLRKANAEQSRVSVTERPVTIGSSPTCDVVLTGESVRPVHARVSARRHGEFLLHAVRSDSSTRHAKHATEQPSDWLIVSAGEEAAIGDWTVAFE